MKQQTQPDDPPRRFARAAGDDELQWLHNGLNPERMARLAEAEIEEARTATSRPRHWRPVEVDEELLR